MAQIFQASSDPALAITPEPLPTKIATKLRDLILTAELEPGKNLNEKQLAELFGVSRTPLREALRTLAQEGLVELLPNKGARVSNIDLQELQENLDILENLQYLIAKLFLRHASIDDLQALEAKHSQMEMIARTSDRSRYFWINQEIHSQFTLLANNQRLSNLEAQLRVKITRARYLARLRPQRWLESLEEHRVIMAAVLNQDSHALGDAMARHVRQTGQAVLEALENLEQPSERHPAE